jgi:signal transduction histidine kinase
MTWWIAALSAIGTMLVLLILVGVLATWQRRAAREAREWGRQVLQAQEDERRRIARELHDSVVPQLFRTRSTAIAAGAADPISDQLGEIAQELRALSHGLHPPGLGNANLAQTLRELVHAEADLPGPRVTLETANETALSDAQVLALYRVAQEAITNARKHAEASAIALTLTRDAQGLRLVIDDDGKGMPEHGAHHHAFGLRSMRERLAMIGGTLAVTPRPGGGTRITARLGAA